MDANKVWPEVQKKYDTLRDSGKTHEQAIDILQKEYTSIGPENQKRLENAYEPKPTGKQTEAGLKPVIVNIDGKEHVYQSPSNPKGLLVFLHGCARSVFGAWPNSSNFRFFGLPDDVSRTKQALKAGYAILYVAPTDKTSGCFSAKLDSDTVIDVVKQMRTKLGLNGKPLYLTGCSAGGGLIQRLVGDGKIGCDAMINESATSVDPSSKTPASVWVCLSTPGEQSYGKDHVNAVKKFGKPADMLISGKRKIYGEYFSDQIASILVSDSKKITEDLKKQGMIDAQGNILKDPKDKTWYNNMSVRIPETTIGFWNSSVSQTLLTAYAVHEEVSLYTTAILKWFEGGCKEDLDALAKKYVVTKPAYFSAI